MSSVRYWCIWGYTMAGHVDDRDHRTWQNNPPLHKYRNVLYRVLVRCTVHTVRTVRYNSQSDRIRVSPFEVIASIVQTIIECCYYIIAVGWYLHDSNSIMISIIISYFLVLQEWKYLPMFGPSFFTCNEIAASPHLHCCTLLVVPAGPVL